MILIKRLKTVISKKKKIFVLLLFTFNACTSNALFKFKQRKIENNLIFDKQKQNATQNNQFTSCKHSQRSNIQNSGECTPNVNTDMKYRRKDCNI